jgi:hypothetical protein
MMHAIHEAELAGLKTPAYDAALDRAVHFLGSLQTEKGLFGLLRGESQSAWTGVGVLGDAMRPSAAIKLNGSNLRDNLIRRFPTYDSAKLDFEIQYFDTLACYLQTGSAWSRWNRLLKSELLKTQAANGSWPIAPGSRSALPIRSGEYELQQLQNLSGTAYRTALCALMLEMSYHLAQ